MIYTSSRDHDDLHCQSIMLQVGMQQNEYIIYHLTFIHYHDPPRRWPLTRDKSMLFFVTNQCNVKPLHLRHMSCFCPPSKHDTLTQCWVNIGPTSKTAGQHSPSIGSIMYRVCWAGVDWWAYLLHYNSTVIYERDYMKHALALFAQNGNRSPRRALRFSFC